MRYDERPADHTPIHTADLPPTPVRDRNIVATAWIEAPAELLGLGDDLPGRPWPSTSAGSATGSVAGRPGNRRRRPILGGRATQLTEAVTFRLYPDGSADGVGPSGVRHDRFRAWKEELSATPERTLLDLRGVLPI